MEALKTDIVEKKKVLVALVESVLRYIRKVNEIVLRICPAEPIRQLQCVSAGKFANFVIVQLIDIEQNEDYCEDRWKKIDGLMKLKKLTSPYVQPLTNWREHDQQLWAVLDSDTSELFSLHPDEEGPMEM